MPSSRGGIVLADGCFDPLHVGHIDYLDAAARMGHTLIVTIGDDDKIRAKGREPFQSTLERKATIDSLRCVTRVSLMSLVQAIEVWKPGILVKGIDWVGQLPADVLAACRAHDVTIAYVDTQTRTSTERLAS
jgi:cytidyltransferase-like protein